MTGASGTAPNEAGQPDDADRRERRLRQKRESEARRRQNRREEVLAQKRAEGQRNRESYRRRQQEWRAANPEAFHAQQAVTNRTPQQRARRLARVVPLGPCTVCGATEDVHRHHPDHSKPLDVVLLCRTHHAEEHARVGV